jgi:hypothetical protein
MNSPDVTRTVLTDDYYGYRMPVPTKFTMDLMAIEDERWAALATIGIERREGVTPLGAWRDAVADESGLARSELDPAQGGRFDCGFTSAYVRQWILYLA